MLVSYLHIVDGQLTLKTNYPYLCQVMSPIKLEICAYKQYFMTLKKWL